MANTIYGEVSWEDDSFSEKKSAPNKDLWMRLKDGSNEMRVVTTPHVYNVHKYKKEGDTGFGQKVNCSIVHGSCPLCDLGDKAKRRWLLGVISRDTGTYKILDISWAVFSGLQKLARNTARWGDPTKYDIDIVVDKNGGATGYYTVQPVGKEPLSVKDQQIKDNANLDELKEKVTPPTPDKVRARMDRIDGKIPGKPGAPVVASTSASVATKAPVAVNLNDDEEDFPEA